MLPTAFRGSTWALGIVQWRKRNIFLGGVQGHFSQFFLSMKCFFPGLEISILVDPNKFQEFQKVKSKKTNKQIQMQMQKNKKQNKKQTNKRVLSSFSYFFAFHFKFSTFPFTVFLLFFSIFPFSLAFLFPVGQQKFSSEKHQGALCAPYHPPAVMPLEWCMIWKAHFEWKKHIFEREIHLYLMFFPQFPPLFREESSSLVWWMFLFTTHDLSLVQNIDKVFGFDFVASAGSAMQSIPAQKMLRLVQQCTERSAALFQSIGKFMANLR